MKRPWILTIGLLLPSLSFLLSFIQSGRAADLETIRQRRYLIVAVKDNVRPLGFKDGAGQWVGLEIDIARRLAQELLGNPDALVLKPVANRERLSVVLADQADLTIARVTATAPRARVVSFSTPYYLDGTALLTAQPDIRTLADLKQRTIAVLQHSTTIDTLKFIVPQAKLVGVNSYEEGRRLLEAGQAQVFAGDATVLAGWTQQYPKYQMLPTLLGAEPLSIVMPKGNQYDDLRRQVNGAIDRWHREGWLQQRATYWGLPRDVNIRELRP